MRPILSWVILLCSLASAGCGPFGAPARVLTPQTSRLKAVHDLYRQEFAKSFLPGNGKVRDGKFPDGSFCTPQDGAFSETLRAIRAYRVDYQREPKCAEQEAGQCDPEASHKTLAHLTVLEGMIYLQSGRPGLASLMQNMVAAQKGQLISGAGVYTRDFIFADNFADLIDAWETVCRWDRSGPSLAEEDASRVSAPARRIGSRLAQYRQEGKLAYAEPDEGAIYMATAAAIFDVWAYKVLQDKCTTNRGCEEDFQTKYFAHGRDLIAPHLSNTEKGGADHVDISQAPPGRLRYILWYQFLKDKAGAASPTGAGSRP